MRKNYIYIIKKRSYNFVKVVSVIPALRGKGCGTMLYEYVIAELKSLGELKIIDIGQNPIKNIDDITDGCHTFYDLYHQRAVLFATICNQNCSNGMNFQ